jgi:hypothetical protein
VYDARKTRRVDIVMAEHMNTAYRYDRIEHRHQFPISSLTQSTVSSATSSSLATSEKDSWKIF